MTPDRLTLLRAAADRMVPRVRFQPDGCLIWTGSLNSRGYGLVSVAGRAELAHRVSYQVEVGPIADDLTVDHLCKTKACVNPAHMEIVTREENSRRGSLHTGQTHCKRGHELAGVNLIVKSRGPGRTPCRNCRECRDEAQLARRAVAS